MPPGPIETAAREAVVLILDANTFFFSRRVVYLFFFAVSQEMTPNKNFAINFFPEKI